MGDEAYPPLTSPWRDPRYDTEFRSFVTLVLKAVNSVWLASSGQETPRTHILLHTAAFNQIRMIAGTQDGMKSVDMEFRYLALRLST